MCNYCCRCGEYINFNAPSVNEDGEVYCGDCAYVLGMISEREYIKHFCFFAPVERAVIYEGEIYLCPKGYKLPWEKTNRDHRHSPEYREWRTKVFTRDNFTCAICNQVGGKLNAHHIKPFRDFEELRYDVNNGITLCEKCHKRVHKEKTSEWLYSRKQKNP